MEDEHDLAAVDEIDRRTQMLRERKTLVYPLFRFEEDEPIVLGESTMFLG